MLFLLAFLGLIVFIGVLVAPRAMTLLIWPVLLLYPQRLLFGLLPLNMGLDDLFVILVGVRILIVPDSETAPKATPVIWLAIILLLLQTVSEGCGIFRYPDTTMHVIKRMLKNGVIVIFVMTLSRVIRTRKDIRQHIISYLVSISLAFLAVLACFLRPSLSSIWVVDPGMEERATFGTAAGRVHGPFGPGSLGIMICVSLALALGIVLHKTKGYRSLKLWGWATIGAAVFAEISGKSRSAILGVAGMLATLSLFSKRRAFVIVLMILGVLVGAYASYKGSELLSGVQTRWSEERLETDMQTRFRCWRTVIMNPSPLVFLFAEGGPALGRRLQVAPHNGYLDIIFEWGLGGVIIYSIFFYRLFKWSRVVLAHDSYPLAQGIAWGLIWGTIGIFFVALTSDPWITVNYHCVTFFCLVIVNTRYQILVRRTEEVIPEELYEVESPSFTFT